MRGALSGRRRFQSLGAGVELQPREAGVEPVLGDEFGVGSLLDDSSVLHHQDPVGGQNGGEAVGDDQRGAALHQPVERLLHQDFIFSVERRSGFVQQQDRRVLENGAGDGEALPLATRKRHAALAEL